jgi:hypothetical protein
MFTRSSANAAVGGLKSPPQGDSEGPTSFISRAAPQSTTPLPQVASRVRGTPFPMMPSANRVFARSDYNFSFRRRSFSNSFSSADILARVAGAADAAGSPDRTPASRALVHSTIWEEYRPSRRRIAPFSPLGAFSYSATVASLYAGVNTSRVGRGAGSLLPAGRRAACQMVWTRAKGSPVLPTRSRTPHHSGCLTSSCARGLDLHMPRSSALPVPAGTPGNAHRNKLVAAPKRHLPKIIFPPTSGLTEDIV